MGLGAKPHRRIAGEPDPIDAQTHRALVAFCSRAHLETLLRALWAQPPAPEPEGAAQAEWPLHDRLWALYGALRFGCAQPPAAAGSEAVDGSYPSPDDDPGGRWLRADDMRACTSLVLLAAGSGADASWPPELRAQADALRASAGRQLVLPPLAAGDLRLAALLLAHAFGRGLADAQPAAPPAGLPAAGSPTSAGASPTVTLPPSDPSQPGGSADRACTGGSVSPAGRSAPPPPGSVSAAAASELRALLELCDPAAPADDSAAPDGGCSPAELCGETQWATQAGVGAFGGMFGLGGADAAEPSSAADSQEQSERGARRAQQRELALAAYAACHPAQAHLRLLAAFLDAVSPHLPNPRLDARTTQAAAAAVAGVPQ